uniref:Neutrophil cytosolic factor 2 n=1 Tax=Callorhinchus milii TaxID=7868 RepID=A0A4W3JVE9_CALMI
MGLKEILKLWDEGITEADRGEWANALKIFTSTEETSSKIWFNIGCLHLLLGELQKAQKAFDMSICKDEHLAVAFYQRGITFFKTENYEEAIRDFKEAFHQLRGNLLIDYHQLGLRYKLFACEVLHNQALAHAQLQTWTEAEEVLKNALGFKTEPKHNFVDEALGAVRNQKLFELLQLPRGQLFRPKKNKVAELEKQDFLGEAKVVASIVDNDEFSGFAPLQPLISRCFYVSKTSLSCSRSLQGELYRVLFNFIPKNEQELRVQSGNIVSVLEKGDDSWATVMFNNKVSLHSRNINKNDLICKEVVCTICWWCYYLSSLSLLTETLIILMGPFHCFHGQAALTHCSQ